VNRDSIDVVHAVTASLSLVLLKGQLSYLRKEGFHPAALCSPGSEVANVLGEESIPIVTVRMEREISPFRDLISLIRLWRTLRELRPVICNAGTPKAGLLVGLAAWLNRVPCRVYTLRGLRLETATGLKRKILFITERIACVCAHRVICVSPSLRQRVIKMGLVSAEKAVVLASGSSNGVDASRFAPTPEKLEKASQIRRALGIMPGQPVIGFTGRFTRDKGVPELIAAFQSVRKRIPSAILLLVGSHEPGDPVSSETFAAIESTPNVLIVEFTPAVDLYYLVMDVFVLPTYREGFPNTVLEAQGAERPVVTTFATGAVDSIQEGVTGLLVPPGDVSALAHALVQLLLDNDLARLMGHAGRERVLRKFRSEIIWGALGTLYREMLAERGLLVPDSSPREAATCIR
jgi:glycosyltransferase involved in cell wall biosynthesis